jgi:hypothetical protein
MDINIPIESSKIESEIIAEFDRDFITYIKYQFMYIDYNEEDYFICI